MNVRSIFMPTRTRQLYSSLLYRAGCSHGPKTDAMTAVRSRSRFEIRQICFHPEATPRKISLSSIKLINLPRSPSGIGQSGTICPDTGFI